MDNSKENENFTKICMIAVEVLPKHLRAYFVQKWNEKFPQDKWKSGNRDYGKKLVDKMKGKNKTWKGLSSIDQQLFEGNEKVWDTTALMYVLQDHRLCLIDPTERGHLDTLRKFRNESFAYALTAKCPFHEFLQMIDEVKTAAKYTLGELAVSEIDRILKSVITSQSSEQMQEQLGKEETRLKEHLVHMKGKYW